MEVSQVATSPLADKQQGLDPDAAGFSLEPRGLQPHGMGTLVICLLLVIFACS